MIFSKYINILAAVLIAFAFASCEKKPEPQKEQPVQQVAKKKKKKKAKKKKVVEEVKTADVDASRFLRISVADENLSIGDVFEGEIDIAEQFKNPNNPSEISVELSLNGTSNGFSKTVHLFFKGGDENKSTWKFSEILSKAGDYKYAISVRTPKNSYFSEEKSFSVGKGDLGIYRVSKKATSRLYAKKKPALRIKGANIPFSMTGSIRTEALDALKAAGANTVRINISAPIGFIVPSGSNAGKYNNAAVKNLENFLKDVESRGLKAILTFASASDFGAFYKNSYFARSGIAPTPQEFFSSQVAIKEYVALVSHIVSRVGGSKAIVLWEPFSAIDAMQVDALDTRASWLTAAVAAVRDTDSSAKRPILLSAGTSSELEYIWSGDACNILGFALSDVKDSALSAWEHSAVFTKKYKKPVATVAFCEPKALSIEDPSFSTFRNAMWAGLMSNSPILPLADFKNPAARSAALAAISEVAEFSKRFNLDSANLSVLRLPDTIAVASTASTENTFNIYPAFAETYPNRETSNDIARIEIDLAENLIEANTIPSLWKPEALISAEIKNVKNDKSALEISIESLSTGADIEIVASSEDAEILRKKFSPAGAKIVRQENGSNMAYVPQKILIPLKKGNQTINFQIIGGTMRVEMLSLRGYGSLNGANAVHAFAAKDDTEDSIAIWFRRSGADSYTVAKHKLYMRNIPKLRKFSYQLPVASPDTIYDIVWWDTKAKKEIAAGTGKSTADSVLKLTVPPFSTDVACFIKKAQ